MGDKEWNARVALLSVITGHRLTGSNPEAPLEKICECGQRFVGLLAQDLHEKEMQEEAVKRIYAAGRAAAPGSLSGEQIEKAVYEAAGVRPNWMRGGMWQRVADKLNALRQPAGAPSEKKGI